MQNSKDLSKKIDNAEILIYTSQDGNVKIEVYIQNDSLWLTQKKNCRTF